MARMSLEKMDILIYDGIAPPDDFLRMFNLQAVFQDWKEPEQLKALPFFLKGEATSAYDKITTKTAIKDVLKELALGCGPKAQDYMLQFHSRRRKPGETMVKYGAVLFDLISKGLPLVEGESRIQMLKAKLNDTSPSEIRLLINYDSDKEWSKLLAAIDRVYPVGDGDQAFGSPIEHRQEATVNYTNTAASRGNARSNVANNGNRFNGECFRCHEMGHRMFECPYRGQNQNQDSRGASFNRNQSINGNRSFNSLNSSNASNNEYNGRREQAQNNNNRSFESRDGSNRSNNYAQQNQTQNSSNRSFDLRDGGNRSNNYVNRGSQNGMRQTNAKVNSASAEQFNSTQMDDNDSDTTSNYSLPSTIHSNSLKLSATGPIGQNKVERQEFPFFCDGKSTIYNNAMETIVMSKDACSRGDEVNSDLLVATVFAQILDNKPRQLKCLIDGGSTHSFISPMALADSHLKRIKSLDPTLKFTQFKIVGATGAVNSRCCVVDSLIEIDKWKGQQSFVISDKVTRYDMVLGRDFLKSNKVKVDHGEDCMKIDGSWISINSVETLTVEDEVAKAASSFPPDHSVESKELKAKLIEATVDILIIQKSRFSNRKSFRISKSYSYKNHGFS